MKLIFIIIVYSMFTGGTWVERTNVQEGYAPDCRSVIQLYRAQIGQAEGYRFEAIECLELEVE